MGKFKTGSILLRRLKMDTFLVEIFYKEGLFDAMAYEIKKSIQELGIGSIKDVRIKNLYRIEGEIDDALLRRICREILIDRVSQDFKIYKKSRGEKGKWTVEVWFKKGVTDTVAETTEKAIRDIGIKNSLKISTGKKYILEGDLRREDVENISVKILANTLIHDYSIKWGK